ncbi:MAG: PmoA family protein [Planctomycetia bacterium]|nr:PmoA family protein [Planctomycetia bacterium]
MKRRDFLRTGALSTAVLSGLSVSFGDDAEVKEEPQQKVIFAGRKGKPYPGWGDGPVEHVTAYNPDFADKTLWIRKDNMVLAAYRNNPNQIYPYIYPLAGPRSMVSVTTESAQPWPHHRSVFLGLDHVNGGNYWQADRKSGQILSQGVKVLEATPTKVSFRDTAIWKKEGQDPIINDSRVYTFDLRSNDYYVLDIKYQMTPIVDITVTKTNHGFFGVRVSPELAPDGGGFLVNSNGQSGQKETEGKIAKWCVLYGKRFFNPSIIEGVAVFCPPKKPFENCPWFTRSYGNVSPMPFNYAPGPWKFPAGQPLEAFYRLVVFAGLPEDVDLNGLWNEAYEN